MKVEVLADADAVAQAAADIIAADARAAVAARGRFVIAVQGLVLADRAAAGQPLAQ